MADATCAGCGCACDDIEITAAGPVRTCPLGDAWFAERTGDRPPVAAVGGREVELEEAVEAAAGILRGARAPLVYGLGGTSCEAQRRAVALAEAAGGVIALAGRGTAGAAYQALGSSTATLGEIRDRAELVVVWRADPVTTHPRLLERLRPRTLVVIDEHRTVSAEQADEFVALGDELDALWALRALVTGAPLARPRPDLADLAQRLLSAGHVAFLYGEQADALALFSLVLDLARDRHAVSLGLRRDGNARGADDVLAWQTGFSGAVSFARGRPEETDGAAALLARGDVDAALVVAGELPAGAAERLPTVVIDARGTATSRAARVAFATAAEGIEVPGTLHRMDGVPLPLRAPLPGGRPAAEDVLRAIEERL